MAAKSCDQIDHLRLRITHIVRNSSIHQADFPLGIESPLERFTTFPEFLALTSFVETWYFICSA